MFNRWRWRVVETGTNNVGVWSAWQWMETGKRMIPQVGFGKEYQLDFDFVKVCGHFRRTAPKILCTRPQDHPHRHEAWDKDSNSWVLWDDQDDQAAPAFNDHVVRRPQ